MDSTANTSISDQLSLNFSSGTSLFCLTSIMKKEQLMKAKQRLKEDQDKGIEAVK